MEKWFESGERKIEMYACQRIISTSSDYNLRFVESVKIIDFNISVHALDPMCI